MSDQPEVLRWADISPPRPCGCRTAPGAVCEHERDEYVIEDGSRTMRPVTAEDYAPGSVRDMLAAAEADLDQRQSAGQRAIRAWSYAAPSVRASVTAVLPLLGAALDDLAGFARPKAG